MHVAIYIDTCVVVCYSVLQCVAVCCSVLRSITYHIFECVSSYIQRTHAPSLSRSRLLSLALARSLSLALALARSLSLTLAHSRSLSLTLALLLSLSFPLSLPLFLSLSFSLALVRSLVRALPLLLLSFKVLHYNVHKVEHLCNRYECPYDVKRDLCKRKERQKRHTTKRNTTRGHQRGRDIRCCPYCCNTLQYTATRCNTSKQSSLLLQHTATHGNTLQCTATYCSTMQHNTLPRTATR